MDIVMNICQQIMATTKEDRHKVYQLEEGEASHKSSCEATLATVEAYKLALSTQITNL